MSLTVWAWNEDDGTLVEYDDRLEVATLEVTQMAEEGAAGDGTVVLEDYTADWYVWPYRPMYFVETAAWGDDYHGLIGPFWTERRVWSRGDERTGARRQVTVTLRDINSLLALRIQKGTDASRDAETDVERVDWLINTAEVIGGFGDHGYTIDETEFFFTDGPVDMSETDYTGQYSQGVLQDCIDQSGTKNFYLYPAPIGSNTLRTGIWYGTTERSDFASLHKISNDLADVSSAVRTNFAGVTPQWSTGYVFPPSIDATLDRDPSRTITGAMLQWDGSNTYQTVPVVTDVMTRRDMVFAGELVKNATQATERLNNLLAINQYEDDAITCAVIVPDWLCHAFVAGNRVQFKATHLADLGYEDYVWMRVAKVTTRQLTGDGGASPGQYELALDLRAETPPGPTPPEPPPPFECVGGAYDATESAVYPRLGQQDGNAAGVHYYWNAGDNPPDVPTPFWTGGSWSFPGFNGSGDFNVSNLNFWRMMFVGPGTVTVHSVVGHVGGGGTNATTWLATVSHNESGINVDDFTQAGTVGVDSNIVIPEHAAADDCIHFVHIAAYPFSGNGGFGANGCTWVAS